MSYSTTRTSSGTFSITDARHIASKLGADLRNLNARTGSPALDEIDDYVEEVALYLKHGYLRDVSYGFKKGGAWTFRMRYTSLVGGQLSDGSPGALGRVAQDGAHFYSYLRRNDKFFDLSAEDRRAFVDTLPIKRNGAEEPTAHVGGTGNYASYSRNSVGLDRDIFRAS